MSSLHVTSQKDADKKKNIKLLAVLMTHVEDFISENRNPSALVRLSS